MVITSRQNERIKAIRALHDRKARQKSGQFLIEGIGLLGIAVESSIWPELVIVCDELCGSDFGQKLLQQLAQRKVPRLDVSPEVFEALTDDRSHGLVAVGNERYAALKDVLDGLWVALDTIAYPPNLGTILRTADAAGFSGVMLLDSSTDAYSPAVVRASRGAVFTQQIVRCRMEEFAAWKKAGRFHVAGTYLGATLDYTKAAYRRPLVVMMGSERYGLQGQHLAVCDELVKIPMHGRCDSLNVAIAAALVMYEAIRR